MESTTIDQATRLSWHDRRHQLNDITGRLNAIHYDSPRYRELQTRYHQLDDRTRWPEDWRVLADTDAADPDSWDLARREQQAGFRQELAEQLELDEEES